MCFQSRMHIYYLCLQLQACDRHEAILDYRYVVMQACWQHLILQ